MDVIVGRLKKMPGTLLLVAINILVYAWTKMDIYAPNDTLWMLGLLERGGLYGPYALNDQWYRLFTHMFMHGHLLHLLFCMYALISVGYDIEDHAGTPKFMMVYLLGGLAAGLCSLYFDLFLIAVGSSGAVFALFGFSLVVNIVRYPDRVTLLVVNFIVFFALNVILADFVQASNAAHIGGAVCGIIIGLLSVAIRKQYIPEIIIAPVLVIIFFSLPRFQVHYFNFFQKLLEAQDSSQYVLQNSGSKSNEQFLEDYRHATSKWDSSLMMLNAHTYVPEKVSSDTFQLRRFITYHSNEARYRINMVENESYIYADSIDIATDSARKYSKLRYFLNIKYSFADTTAEKPEGPPLQTVQVWYDSNWVELAYPPSEYYRIGQRDTAGLWQGPLLDYFKTGVIQMKGSYKDDMKNGIFIYYTDKGKYSAAGVYHDDQRVGKWETFHPNGKIESEVFYRDRYFLKSYWDSTGIQMVRDGNGTEVHRYPNGVVASEGNYVDGYQEGYWYGKHPDGSMYFEENYSRGRLVNGRSRSTSGKTAVYDETVFFALPEGGARKYREYIQSQVVSTGKGTVKLSFRVTVSGQITDFKIEQSVSKELDLRAKQIVLTGPRWLPARLHGLEPTDGWGFVSVEF